jgi:pyridoxamine 5'-phosphate oxidase
VPATEDDPLELFREWFVAAQESGLDLPEAMTLATASADGSPSARTVLLKGTDERGFVFFTNYESRKGRELAENPRAALVFHWAQEPRRQVLVTGGVMPLPAEESDEYFRTRPVGSRLAAWASRQSRPLAARDELERSFAEAETDFGDDPPRPPYWGGYVLEPITMEFWESRPNRLHERFRYTRHREGWTREQLSP